jgi:signal recognition particle subunit SRP72
MLFDFQSRLCRTNAYTLDLEALKYSGVAKSTSNAVAKQATPTTSPSVNTLAVLNAAAHAKSGTGKSGLKQILPELEKRPNDVGLLLTVIQLYTLTNNHGAAISLLESFLNRLDKSVSESDEDVRFSPGLVAVLVGLYKIQARKNHIQIELAKAASYWRRKSKPPTALLRAAGTSLLESSNPEYHKEAEEIFATLHKSDPNDRLAIAGYVASHASTSSTSELESLTSRLTPINRLTANINISALEEAGISHLPSTISLIGKRPAEAQASKPTKKKPRKARLPKDYDPNKPPDPERWLPLRERSTYRPKGKRGKQKAAQMTQGGFSGTGEKADDSGADAGKAGGPPKSTGGGGGGAKKKKAKGKK